MHPTCQCVLSQKDPNDSNICRASPLRPSDSIDTGTVDERLEDELATLELRSCSEDGNGEGDRSERIPPHGYVIQMLEDMHAEGVNRACIEFALSLGSLNKG